MSVYSGNNKKYILVCHSYSCLLGLCFNKMYKNKCSFNVFLDNSPYYEEINVKTYNSKYFKNESETVKKYFKTNSVLLAVKNGHYNIVKWILNYNKNYINGPRHEIMTRACEYNRFEIIMLLKKFLNQKYILNKIVYISFKFNRSNILLWVLKMLLKSCTIYKFKHKILRNLRFKSKNKYLKGYNKN
jgi:hypothetical protein